MTGTSYGIPRSLKKITIGLSPGSSGVRRLRPAMELTIPQLLTLGLIACIPVAHATRPQRVVGGLDAEPAELPYQVYLTTPSASCSGSIISSTHILTAAHCLRTSDREFLAAENVNVYSGSHKRRVARYNWYNVSRITPHPDYNPKVAIDQNRRKFYADIAVLELSRPIRLDVPTQHTVHLPSIGTAADTRGIASGWGLNFYDEKRRQSNFPDVLQKLEMIVLNRKKCGDIRYFAAEGQICAIGATKASNLARGDSGAPLVHNGEVIGVVSWGEGQYDRQYPTVFTDVFYFRQWITDIIS